MTRRDSDARDFDGGDFLGAMRDSMRDSYDYIHSGDRDPQPNGSSGSSSREGFFGNPRDLAGLIGGGALVGLMSGLLGNANIGSTGIPNAIIPAAIGFGASYFDLLGRFDRDVKNAATGALIVGAGLWALSQGVRIQAARQQAPAVVMAGAPPAALGPASQPRVGQMPPYYAGNPVAQNPGYAAPPPHLPPRGMPNGFTQPRASEMPLSEHELISIAQRY